MMPYSMLVRSSCSLIANDLNLDEPGKSIKNKKFSNSLLGSLRRQNKRSDTSSLQTEVYLSIESGLLASFYSGC